MPRPGLPLTAILVATTLFLSGRADAELGGTLPSVDADRARMGAKMVSVGMGGYARHVLTRANGGTVRELTNPNGEVFAVTWSGPGKPDLRSLLGSHFAAFQAASGATGREMHSLRRPQQVAEPDLQIQTEGHMGWFRGVAIIPSLAPAGFSPNDLRQDP